MSDLTLRQLRYFLAVVDHGSISNAAEQEHISQAAMSLALKQLEGSLGVSLFNRSQARRATPTPDGHQLIPYARRVTATVDEVTQVLNGDMQEMRGRLRLGCMQTISPRVIPPLLEHFAHVHPRVEVTFDEMPAQEVHRQLELGEIDLGFVYAGQRDTRFAADPVAEVSRYVILPADHPCAEQRSVSLADLAHLPLILVDGRPTVGRVTSMLRDIGLNPQIQWVSKNIDVVHSLVARGLGYSFLNGAPKRDIDELVSIPGMTRSVVYRDIVEELPSNTILMVYSAERVFPVRVEEAMAFIRRQRRSL